MSAEFIDLVKQTLLVDVEAWGGGSVGRAAGGWTPRLCCKSNRCLSSDGCFLANMTLGSSDVNLIQNKHNGLNFPYTKHLILQKVFVMTVHYFKLEIWTVDH